MKGRAIVVQTGGPSAVINSSVCGIVQAVLESPGEFDGIYGAINGIIGVLTEDLCDLSQESPADIERLQRTPSAALGSSRYKLKDPAKDPSDYRRIVEVFRAHDIRRFFQIGGNGSMGQAGMVERIARQMGYDLQVIGVPKTIDNDMPYTDHCPGYPSVAKFSATAAMEAGRDTESIYTFDTVTVHEVMGRNTGWVAAATGMAHRCEEDAPHLIYLPEIPFDRAKFADDVRACLAKFRRAFIVCGEGLKYPDGQFISAATGAFAQDAHGQSQLGGAADALRLIVENDVGVKCRTNRAGTAQRNAIHFASATDIAEAALAGRAAVEAAIAGETGKMVTLLRRETSGPYSCTTGLVELEKVANGEKPVPAEFINKTQNGVTEAFRDYLRPLLQGEAKIDIGTDGLPVFVRLARHRVAKRIANGYAI